MNPDYFPWQVGIPLAGLLWGWLAVRWHLDRKRGGGRGARQEGAAEARPVEVPGPRTDAAATAAPGGAGAGDGGGDTRVAGRRWSTVRGELVATLAGVRS